jgi:hypothetical protein
MKAIGILALALCTVGPLFACDPVHDDAVSALGGEAPGVRRGPLHRPGQPCILCHDGAIGDPQRFTVAGTVFQTPGAKEAAVGATVKLTDANGTSMEVTTNAAGNFYLTPSQYDPVVPVQVLVNAGGSAVKMQTLIAGNLTEEPNNGSCASCHVDPAGPSSPGHVCLMLDDGGTPP